MNFVCIVFELGDKMLTLSSMENLIVPCNLQGDFGFPTRSDTKIGLCSHRRWLEAYNFGFGK